MAHNLVKLGSLLKSNVLLDLPKSILRNIVSLHIGIGNFSFELIILSEQLLKLFGNLGKISVFHDLFIFLFSSRR